MSISTRPSRSEEDGHSLHDLSLAQARTWPRGTRVLRYGGDYNPEQWPRATWRASPR